jgi:phage-related protein
MADEPAWQIVYYTDERGNSPVEEFLEGLDAKSRARFIWSLERLVEENVRAREPLVKKLEGKLYELRRASDGNIFRLFYFFYTGKNIVLLHGFQKKTQKTPRREIEMAQRRMDDFIKRAGGE